MDCKHVNDHLVDFLYQELDADEADRIDGHLRQCEGCADELSSFDATRRLMQQLPQLEPPAAVTERLLQQAQRAIQPETPGLWERLRSGLSLLVLHPAMTAAVALVLVLGISFHAYRQSEPPPRDARTGRPSPEEIGLPAPAGQPAPAHEPQLVREDEIRAQGAGKDKAGQPSQLQAGLDQPAREPATTAKSATRAVGKGRVGKLAARARRPRPARRRPKAKPRGASYRKGPAADDLFAAPNAVGGARAAEEQEKKQKEDRKAADWLALARKASKAGACDQALRYYHRALEVDPGLRRTVGPEVQRCARVVAAGGTDRLLKAQKQLPLLAGWLEAELSVARRKAARRSNPAAKPAPRPAQQVKPTKTPRSYSTPSAK